MLRELKRPIPFVEDYGGTTRESRDFIMEFRAVADSYHVQYGMFGHGWRPGVLHVRQPWISRYLKSLLIRNLLTKWSLLLKNYKWFIVGANTGKGVRSEYAPAFFGKTVPSIQASERRLLIQEINLESW